MIFPRFDFCVRVAMMARRHVIVSQIRQVCDLMNWCEFCEAFGQRVRVSSNSYANGADQPEAQPSRRCFVDKINSQGILGMCCRTRRQPEF